MRYLTLIFMVIFISAGLFARPDVFFTDSQALYNGAYLRHQFNQDFSRITFYFDAPVAGVALRSYRNFDFNNLKRYIENVHQFHDQNLRREMIQMMGLSFYSRFNAQPFLQELTAVLTAYLLIPGNS